MALIESFSGIRGVFGNELTENVAVRYGYSFAEFLKMKKNEISIVIGMDTRESGEKLRSALIEGLDCDIVDVGVLPTPAVQHAVREYKADGGIIITASHNEPEFNGFKFLDKDGAVVRPDAIQKIISRFHELNELSEEDFLGKNLYKENKMESVKKIMKVHIEALYKYKKFIHSFFSRHDLLKIKTAKVKLILDVNGGAGKFCKNVFDELGVKATYVNMDKIARKVEPNEESLKYLVKEMAKQKADFAAGFDLDGDRVEIMMADGRLISGNQILALVVEDVLSDARIPEQETIVVNDATSFVVKSVVDSYNAKWKEVEVGEINVVDTMIGFNSLIGGEGSNGGVIFPPSKCRDGILTILYILKILGNKQKPLNELIDVLDDYTYIKDKVRKDIDRDKVTRFYLERGFVIEETGDEEGGLKAIKDNSWVWFRKSRTEHNVLRIIVDSRDKDFAVELLKQAKQLVQRNI